MGKLFNQRNDLSISNTSDVSVLVDEISKFYLSRKRVSNPEDLSSAIRNHIKYGTIVLTIDSKGISGLVRFNINGYCVHVLDLLIRKDCERAGIIKVLALNVWSKWPHLKFFSFKRKLKYPGRNIRAYLLSRLLKGN